MENEAPNSGVNVSRRARRPRGWWKHVVETKLLPQSTLAAVLPQSTVAAVIEGRNSGIKEWEFQERAGMGQVLANVCGILSRDAAPPCEGGQGWETKGRRED
jgi:hypothetical protein